MLRRKEGFTLIELLIVILIIAILVAIALPLYLNSQKNARLRTCQANLRTLDGAINAYRADYEAEPQNGAAGVDDLVNSGYMKKAPLCPQDKTKAYVLWSAVSMPLEASCVVAAAHTL
jgi:prepilin-type N-terminal cleavage/methylation domain-containing protein